MIIRLNVLVFCFFVNSAFAVEIIAPIELQISEFKISDPDVLTKTLGTVSFQIDLSAAHDDLLALKVRRSDLKLKDGRSFTAFGVHKKAGVIIIAGGDVTHLSIASVSDKQKGRDAGVLFYGKDNKVISPKLKDIAVFDADFKPLDFNYTPMKSLSSLHMPVAIALDTSGSMDGHLGAVVSATRDFMKKLPGSARCQIFTFSNDVVRLSDNGKRYLKSCPYMIYHLNKPLKAGGATALYKAIETGFESDIQGFVTDLPNITIVVTDGINTADYGQTLESLKATKAKTNSKLFVFWVGNYETGHLKGLADLEIVSTNNLDADLQNFFQSLGVSISGLQVLHIGK